MPEIPAINLAPSILFHLGPLAITTTFLLQLLISLLIIATFSYLARNYRLIPGKFQLLMEELIMAAWKQVNTITGSYDKTKKIFPLIFCFFIFIATSNLFTLLPGLGAVNIASESGKTALFRSVLADYSMVLVLTLITVFLAQFLFILYNGLWAYLKKFFNFSSPLAFVLGLMDIIGELAKILSLSFRLFGNVFAGEVLMAVITALVPFIIPFPFFALTLFSSVIQAFVFSVLSAVFISSSMESVSSGQNGDSSSQLKSS